MQNSQSVLFLCSMNRLRSPTAETVFSCVPGMSVKSAGLEKDAVQCCTLDDLLQADIVFVMEQRHRVMLKKQFDHALLRGRQIVNLNIPDEFDRMQPELVDLLLVKVPPFLGVAVDRHAVLTMLKSRRLDGTETVMTSPCWS